MQAGRFSICAMLSVLFGAALVASIADHHVDSLVGYSIVLLFLLFAQEACLAAGCVWKNNAGNQDDQVDTNRGSQLLIPPAAMLVWLVIAKPSQMTVLEAVVSCLVAVTIIIVAKRALSKQDDNYGSVKLTLILNAVLITLETLLLLFINSLGGSLGVRIWAEAGIFLSFVSICLAIRERYMSWKRGLLKSGKTLPPGIDPPMPALGNRAIRASLIVVLVFAVICAFSLPWGLREFIQIPVTEEWAKSQTGTSCRVEAIIKTNEAFFWDDTASLIYELSDDSGANYYIEVLFPSTNEEISHPDMMHYYIQALRYEFLYLSGSLQPSIIGFCDEPIFGDRSAKYLWRRDSTGPLP